MGQCNEMIVKKNASNTLLLPPCSEELHKSEPLSDVGKILCRQFGSSKLDEVSARQRWYLITGWGKFWSNGRSESFRCDQLLYHFFKVPFQLLFHIKVLKIKFLTYLKFYLHQETHRISTKSITSYHCKNLQTFS